MSILSSIIKPKTAVKLVKKSLEAALLIAIDQFDIRIEYVSKRISFKVYSIGTTKYRLIPYDESTDLYNAINVMVDEQIKNDKIDVQRIDLLIIEYNEITPLFVNMYYVNKKGHKDLKRYEL